MISHKESMEWEMDLLTMKELVFGCGAEIACLQKLVGRLESGARITIRWIIVQLTTGLVVIGGECFFVFNFLVLTPHHWDCFSTYSRKLKM